MVVIIIVEHGHRRVEERPTLSTMLIVCPGPKTRVNTHGPKREWFCVTFCSVRCSEHVSDSNQKVVVSHSASRTPTKRSVRKRNSTFGSPLVPQRNLCFPPRTFLSTISDGVSAAGSSEGASGDHLDGIAIRAGMMLAVMQWLVAPSQTVKNATAMETVSSGFTLNISLAWYFSRFH